jgi:C4-dicarboxylate-specific signal transduction histidine kinase
MFERRTPERIVLLYAITGCAWILFSDRLVAALFKDPETMIWMSQLKGWAYVLVTSLLLFWLIRSSTRRLVQSETILRQQADDLVRSHQVLKQAEQALQQANTELEARVEDRTRELCEALDQLQEQTDERLRIAEELRENERMLAQQSRQAAMGQMIGNIAHQWRQPLNALALNIQQLPLLYQIGEFSKEMLENSVHKSMGLIKHMSRTIDDFRDFFSPEKEMAEFTVDRAVQKALELVKDSLAERAIVVEVACPENLVVNGYLNEYSQVLLNILLNARDAFDVHPCPLPLVRISAQREDGHVTVAIADNAGGIAPEILENIFEPYFSTKGVQGTGIGLYMSKTIIERNMRGRLTARNIGDGAEFRIEI